MTITVPVNATFAHHAAIYQPRTLHPSPTPKYGIVLPAVSDFNECNTRMYEGYTGSIVKASSDKPPLIMIGDGSAKDETAWTILCDKAARWRIPLDVLLTGRLLKVACSLWMPTGPYATGKHAVNLFGVQILGDLTKSPTLDARIAEIKGWFE